MAVPIRLICANCQSSVEASGEVDGISPAYCPTCFCPIEEGRPAADVTDEVGPRPDSWGSADAPTPWASSIGRPPIGKIGRFQLGDWIGGGGYGDVYLARDPRLDREVALKVLKPTKLDAKASARFLREAQAAAKLSHRNIVVLHDAGQDEGRLWIAYQLVKGRTLSQLRDAQLLDLPTAVTLVRDLALALDHAHRRGIFHRDLKPANVIVDDEGVPHLTDFGLARRLDLDSELTGEGTVLGTPAYMSPEQAAGRANAADGRSDIYSLGVVLYELICGRRPSDVPSNTPFWKIERKTPPPTPQSIDRAIPHQLDRICMTALALNPDDRYADAKTFARALDDWLSRKQAARPRRLAAIGIAAVAMVAVPAMLLFGLPNRGGVAHPLTLEVPPNAIAGTLEKTRQAAVKPVAPAPFVAGDAPSELAVVVNIDSRKVHRANGPDVARMSEKNRKDYPSLEAAGKEGYTSRCSHCFKDNSGP